MVFRGVQITNSAQVLTVLVTPGASGYSLINGMQIFPENPAAVIITQPTNQTVNVGGSASFTVAASGLNPLYYQWQLGGTNLPGATGPHAKSDQCAAGLCGDLYRSGHQCL